MCAINAVIFLAMDKDWHKRFQGGAEGGITSTIRNGTDSIEPAITKLSFFSR
jgi:hypothetical protein